VFLSEKNDDEEEEKTFFFIFGQKKYHRVCVKKCGRVLVEGNSDEVMLPYWSRKKVRPAQDFSLFHSYNLSH